MSDAEQMKEQIRRKAEELINRIDQAVQQNQRLFARVGLEIGIQNGKLTRSEITVQESFLHS